KTSTALLASNAVSCLMLAEGRDDIRGDVTMTAEQQQALDSFYALDNVITVKITMPQAEWDAVRLEGRQQVHVAQSGHGRDIGDKISCADDVHGRRCQKEIVLRLDRRQEALPAYRLRQVQQLQRGRDRSPDRVALRDAQQFQTGQVLHQADAGLQVAGYGRVAQFAVQLRPSIRERNS